MVLPIRHVRLIGVHVRRGDYVNHPAGYKVATKQYLEKAVLWYQSRYKNIYFIVALRMFSINLFASFRISSLKINCCRNSLLNLSK
jgi:hypothetical protein